MLIHLNLFLPYVCRFLAHQNPLEFVKNPPKHLPTNLPEPFRKSPRNPSKNYPSATPIKECVLICVCNVFLCFFKILDKQTNFVLLCFLVLCYYLSRPFKHTFGGFGEFGGGFLVDFGRFLRRFGGGNNL